MKTTAPLLIMAMAGVAGCSFDRPPAPAAPPPPATAAAPAPARTALPTVRPTRRRTPPAVDAGSSGTSAPPGAEAAESGPAPVADPPEDARHQLAALPAALPAAADPVGTTPAPAVTPARLVGLDPTETTRLLGRPAETVEAPPALRWSWRAGGCTLRLFFFMDLKTRDFRALSYQTSGYDDANDADLRCLADVVAKADTDARR